jgi:phage terminase large subunit
VRDRINCVNARLRNQAGDSRLFIDPKCKELIRDLEEVSWAVDSTGAATEDLNKSDKNRTHTSDALGYFIYPEFPMSAKIGEKSTGPILSF